MDFLNSKLDSDEEDEDYVPDAAEGSVEKPQAEDEEENLTGIALLKANKRKKEIDDIFALMQEEDYSYAKKKAALVGSAAPVVTKA